MASLELLGLLLIAALLVGLIGFVRTVWFISIGYAASIVVFVFLTAAVFGEQLVLPVTAQLVAALVWGLRLGFFLVLRERNPAYQSTIKDQTDRSESLSLIVKAGIWISVSLLYVCMFAPVIFLADAVSELNRQRHLFSLGGVAIMWLGLVIEAKADRQKSLLKAANPKGFVSSGLYSWVRFPNYLGEILFWMGNFMAGIVAYNAWWHWAIVLIGVICIVLIMMGSTKRLERKQDERYGEGENYKEYVRTVPILIPWVPIYTLKNVRVYLG
jgi:steroid 5-alpha reductase family enzyme